jgi:hypothetical protein
MKNTASFKLTYTKLTNAQQYYEQISYTEFHPNCTVMHGKYGEKYIYTPNHSVTLIAPIFTILKKPPLSFYALHL